MRDMRREVAELHYKHNGKPSVGYKLWIMGNLNLPPSCLAAYFAYNQNYNIISLFFLFQQQ